MVVDHAGSPMFVNSTLASSYNQLPYSADLFCAGQSVAIYYNDELGWLPATVSVQQKKKTWVCFEGETEEYCFAMTQTKYGDMWAFTKPTEAQAQAQ